MHNRARLVLVSGGYIIFRPQTANEHRHIELEAAAVLYSDAPLEDRVRAAGSILDV